MIKKFPIKFKAFHNQPEKLSSVRIMLVKNLFLLKLVKKVKQMRDMKTFSLVKSVDISMFNTFCLHSNLNVVVS